MLFPKVTFKQKDTERLKIKVMKVICYVNTNQKRAGVAIWVSDKIDFKAKEYY